MRLIIFLTIINIINSYYYTNPKIQNILQVECKTNQGEILNFDKIEIGYFTPLKI